MDRPVIVSRPSRCIAAIARATAMAGLLVLLSGTPVAAQDQADQLGAAARDQAVELFRRAEAVFNSAEQDRSVRLLTDLISLLERRVEITGDGEMRGLLVSSVSYRAQAHYNFGQAEQADEDMRKLISLDPAHNIDAGMVSPKFVERFEEIRAGRVGRLDVILTPSNAELLVDGRQARPSLGPIPVMVGTRVVSASRPGHESYRESIEVAAGETLEVLIDLERTFAVAKLITHPRGAGVVVDGRPVGVTQGSAPLEFFPLGEAGQYPITEFSDYMNLELLPGTHEIEVALDGYRTARFAFVADALTDYEIDPVLLAPASGDVVLRGLPPGSTVAVDGESAPPPDAGTARLTVSPGRHVFSAEHPTAGYFETRVAVSDGDELSLDVELRPVANLVGIVGADPLAAESISATLAESFQMQDSWILRNRIDDAAAVLDQMTTMQAVLQEAARGSDTNLSSVPWRRIQAALDEEVPGSLHLLAVLSDDLMATHADIWVIAPAPGPRTPDRVRVALEDLVSIERFASSLNLPEFELRAWWGATLLDGPTGVGPIVAALEPEGPATQAGVRVGDVIRQVGGREVRSAGDVHAAIAAATPESPVEFVVRRGAADEPVTVTVGSSPSVVFAEDPAVPAAAGWVAALRALDDQTGRAPEWMLQLSAAIAQVRARDWTGAVRTLRTIEAPAGQGLGQAAVDYWLGVALLGSGSEYEDSAREAFLRATTAGGRLGYNDGPPVRPRARARLSALGLTDGGR